MLKRQRCDSDDELFCPSFSAAACICCEGFLAEGLLKQKCNRCRGMPFLLDVKGHCYPSDSGVLMEEACARCGGSQALSSSTRMTISCRPDYLLRHPVFQACAGCGATLEETTALYRCSGCMLASYCSENCQLLHWDQSGPDNHMHSRGHWIYCTTSSNRPKQRIKAIRRRLRYLKKKVPVGLEKYGHLVLLSTMPVKFSAVLANGILCLLTFSERSSITSTPVTLRLRLNETGKKVPAYHKVFLTKASAVRWIFDADPDYSLKKIVNAWLRTPSPGDKITMTPIW